MKRRLIWFAILIPATFYLLLFVAEGFPKFVKSLHLSQIESGLSQALPIIGGLALGIGVINVFGVHGANVVKHREGWGLSLVVFASFVIVFVAMFWQYGIDGQRRAVTAAADAAWKKLGDAQKLPTVTERDAALAKLTPAEWTAIQDRRAFEDEYRFEPRIFIISYMQTPLVATVMALLGFYITYAAYRAFRIRSVEATVMMISAAVVILGSDPIGGWLTHGTGALAAEFDNGVLNSGMQRGLQLGIGVAVIAASLRMMLGLERGILEVRQEGA